jgi:c-di-GMP-binding flagellar brake protein YcgR
MGRIAWVAQKEREKEAGINFINLTDVHKEDIYNYIFRYYREELTNKWWENM